MQLAAPSSCRWVKFSTNAARTPSNPGLTKPAIAKFLLLSMILLLFVAPSTADVGWFLCSLRSDHKTRPSHLHHDDELWSLMLITKGTGIAHTRNPPGFLQQ